MFFIKWLIIIAIVYFVLNKLIFPVFRVFSINGNNIRQMQDKINDLEKKVNKQNKTSAKKGDYIDYEEMK